MGLFCRKETGVYYLKIKENGKYRKISLGTKNKYIAEQIYNAYLLDIVKEKINVRRNSDFLSISALQTSCLRGSSKHKNESLSTSKSKSPKTPKNGIKKLYDEYLESCKAQKLSKYTIQRKEKVLELLLGLKIKSVKDINQITVNGFLELMNDKTDETKIRNIKNFKAFLNYCISVNKYDFNIYKTLKFPVLKGNTRDIVIDEKDYLSMLNHADDDFKLYMMSLWETGCRPNEITQLRKSDIDFNKGTAKIYQTKTKKYKTVYLTDKLLEKFKNLESDYIFDRHNKQKEYYAKKFRELRDKLELNKEYCLYAFRHTFGTRILNKTKDIHLVSKLLGHSDISITAKHYINRSDEEIRRKLLDIT